MLLLRRFHMQFQVALTDAREYVGAVPCRVFAGRDETGQPVRLLVHAVQLPASAPAEAHARYANILEPQLLLGRRNGRRQP
jgi:hypothetical protein